LKGKNLKYILKKAFDDWLPTELKNRPKKGFEIPVGEWFKKSKSFRKLFWDTVNSGSLSKQDIFCKTKINSLYEDHLQNRNDNSHKLWAILVFQWWYWGSCGPGGN
jgi:asparagine synthase (glutamine-hydrolysing)